MPYDIYVLSETDVTISGGGILDGITQGDGSHLDGLTITLNAPNWSAISINDDDGNFQDNDTSQRLNGTQTVNGTSYADNSVVEAEYGITLSDGVNTWQLVAFNVTDSSPAYSTVEGLAFIGGPGGFPPVGVPLTVVGTQEGPNYAAADYATPTCFVAGTLIETQTGLRPIETITIGDLVWTQDDGLQPVRWSVSRQFAATGHRAPIVFAAGAIGNTGVLSLSPQHRICLNDWRAQLWCGEDSVLIPAKAFVNGTTVRQVAGGTVCYHHLMFDCHQIIRSEGVLTESFHPGQVGIDGFDAQVRAELFSLFPELGADVSSFGPVARRDVRGHEAHVLLVA